MLHLSLHIAEFWLMICNAIHFQSLLSRLVLLVKPEKHYFFSQYNHLQGCTNDSISATSSDYKLFTDLNCFIHFSARLQITDYVTYSAPL